MAHDDLIAVFVIIAALALALQAAVMVGIYLVVHKFLTQTDRLMREVRQRVEPLIDAANGIAQDAREPVRSVLVNLSDISRVLKERTNVVDARVGEMLETIRAQVIHIDEVIGISLEKATNAAETIQSAVLGPVSQLSAVIKGVQTGIDYFFSRRRSPNGREVTPDEELFI